MAGLMAATYLGQAGVSPLVIEGMNPGGAIIQSEHVRNWPGFLDISGYELIERMHEQAASSGARFEGSKLVDIDLNSWPYVLTLENLATGKTYQIKAQSVGISMGTSSKFLGVPGEEQYWTRGVYNCALCDGPLYKDKNVAVVGGSNSAITEALYLSNIAKKVTILMRGQELRSLDEATKKELLSRPNVEIRPLTTVENVEGDGEKMTHVILQNGEKLELDALFLAIGSTPNTEIFKGKLNLDEKGYIITDEIMQTSAKGIFAFGDITQTPCKQAVCAAGQGAEASMYITDYLNSVEKPKQALLGASPEVIEITSLEQFEEIMRNSDTPVVVDFYATWCPPCRRIAPIYAELAKQYDGKIKFLKVNVDVSELAQKFEVRAMPTFLFFNENKEIVDRLIGANEAHLRNQLELLIA
ncbi:MAG: FAD-dependent oxidoreductase [Parachlamydiales bacterium]|nr:FAD-dependent oxidoreductase [Parachlamydiales bacterium]